MTEFIAYLMIILSFIMMIGKVSACGASFVLASNRDKMPDEIKGDTVRSDVVHGFNDAAQAAFFMALIVFILSNIREMYGNYEMVYTVAAYMVYITFILTFIYFYAFKIRKKIDAIRDKWKKQKRFGDEHDNEVNYCHAMENVAEDMGINLLMGLFITAIILFG